MFFIPNIMHASRVLLTSVSLIATALGAPSIAPAAAQTNSISVEWNTAFISDGTFRAFDRKNWVPEPVARDWQPFTVGNWLNNVSPVTTIAVQQILVVSIGDPTRPPIGWIEFCVKQPQECAGAPLGPREVLLTAEAWKDLVRVNSWVNHTIKPLSDLDHWGVEERWSYPDDGYGDCEDYVLLKRRMLIQTGWPSEVLLITMARDKAGKGHAVLTVKTDRGEFILDNLNLDILFWLDTDYRFIKRQSQRDPNIWVSLGDSRPAISTASSQ